MVYNFGGGLCSGYAGNPYFNGRGTCGSLGFRVFGVWGLGFRAQGLQGLGVLGLGFRVFRV